MEEDAPSLSEVPERGKPGAHAVVVRLLDWSLVELGSFQEETEALDCARSFVRSTIDGEESSGWPLAGNRFLRPEAIVSVDVVAGHTPKWSGSTARARWARPPAEGEPAAPASQPATGPPSGEPQVG